MQEGTREKIGIYVVQVKTKGKIFWNKSSQKIIGKE